MQNVLNFPFYLMHHEPNRPLYINVNALRQFGAMVYHIKNNRDKKPFSIPDIEFFLIVVFPTQKPDIHRQN